MKALVVSDRDFADFLREFSPITVQECHTPLKPHKKKGKLVPLQALRVPGG
jgi:hypothetical protein